MPQSQTSAVNYPEGCTEAAQLNFMQYPGFWVVIPDPHFSPGLARLRSRAYRATP